MLADLNLNRRIGKGIREDDSPSYSGFMRAVTWRPMASVRPVVRMGIGVSDMMDLVLIANLRKPFRSLLGAHDKDIYIYVCVGNIQRIVSEASALSPEHIRGGIISQSTGL